jgi:hypothetical protein
MQQTQPYRQVTPAMLLSTLPAAAFVTRIAATRALARAPRALQLAALVCGVALVQQLVATQVLYQFTGLIREPKPQNDQLQLALSKHGYPWRWRQSSNILYGVPHSDEIDARAESVSRWLTAHLPRGARLLVEGRVLGERLAWRSRFEVLGGFFERNIRHVDANYFRSHTAVAIDPDELAHYLRTFAVDWVVGEGTSFENVPHLLERVAVVSRRHIYRTQFPTSRVLHGGGLVDATENNLVVHHSTPSDSLLLSYHWHEALRCRPNCTVERAPIDIDRVGFVRVPAPHPADLVVWNSYEHW